MNAAPSTVPFFIVGAGRSGSTLLRLMLSAHSRIAIPPETWYLTELLAQLPIDRPLDADEVRAAVSIMVSHYRWRDMGLGAAELRTRVAHLRRPRLRDVVEIVYRHHMEIEGKRRWGDKTPPYIEIVPALADLFGDAKFIHLIRDGHDVAKSYQKQGWHGPWMQGYTREWLRAAEWDRKLGQTALNDRILRVRYEDLVRHPQATLRRICAFIDETFEDQMLGWREKIDAAVPHRERRFHTSLARDLSPSAVGRWRREMTPREVFVVEALIGGELSRFGYERRYRGKLWSPLFAATRLYCRAVLPVVGFPLGVFRFLRRRLRRGVRLVRPLQ